MKKLLAVLLVLGIANAVSAAVVLDPAMDGIVLDPSDTILIPIITDDSLYGLNAAVVVVSGPGSIVGASGTAAAGELGWDPTLSFDPAVDGQRAEIGFGTFGAPGTGQVGFIEFHCDGEGPVVLEIQPAYGFGGSAKTDFTEPQIGGTITIVQTPEPMTMSLLGLGGLALIRRRRA